MMTTKETRTNELNTYNQPGRPGMPFICWRMLSPTSIHNGPPRHNDSLDPIKRKNRIMFDIIISIFLPEPT